MRQIFRKLLELDEARKIIRHYGLPHPLGIEQIPLGEAYGRVLGRDIVSPVDVPGFDRAAMDGYAVKAEDTYGASEAEAIMFKIIGRIKAGEVPQVRVSTREAVEIATGGLIPAGVNAVVMVEYTHEKSDNLHIYKSVAPGENISSTGSDISIGETILREGNRIAAREFGILSAIGFREVPVYQRPRVAVASTGDELLHSGEDISYGKIYDINLASISSLLGDCGCIPLSLGIIRDDIQHQETKIREGLEKADVIVTSGGTSAGSGDTIYHIFDQLGNPGVIIHGLAVKPGKPTVVAVLEGKPVFGLPGYPTSALTVFNILVKPFLLEMTGLKTRDEIPKIIATMPFKYITAKGRREFIPVRLFKNREGNYSAYPILSGSGAVTSYSLADGFIEVNPKTHFLEEKDKVSVILYSKDWRPPDLTVIGSHCLGVDILLSLLSKKTPPIMGRSINVGSMAGLKAAGNGETDIAGIHLLHSSGVYNLPFLSELELEGKVKLFKGYFRKQGFIVRPDLESKIDEFQDIFDLNLSFINRNKGSGTRSLIDSELKRVAWDSGESFNTLKNKLQGYWIEARTHSSVASAVKHGRADVGLGIEAYARKYGLGFKGLWEEEFDFAVPNERVKSNTVKFFIKILTSNKFKENINKIAGFRIPSDIGSQLK